MLSTDFQRSMAERDRRIEAARGPFEAVQRFLRLTIPRWDSRRRPATAYDRLVKAMQAVREWRYANNQQMQDSELEKLAVLICADQFAEEIQAAAHDAGQDPATIAWVVAGLRCTSRPFCTGCASCFTITSPLRPNGSETS